MQEYNELKQLIRNLSDEEFKSEFTRIISQPKGKSFYLKLIDYVRYTQSSSSEEAQFFLYGSLKSGAFNQLIYRAKDNILESLMEKEKISKCLVYDERAKEILQLRKQLIQFDILCLRGLSEIARKMVNKIIGLGI